MIKFAARVSIIIIGILVILSAASPSFAQDPAKKLGRGVVNILTGWLELPKNIYDTSAESNAFAGATIGLVKGLGMTVVRTGAGIYDTATFPFALPQEYKPILEPEYVLEKGKADKDQSVKATADKEGKTAVDKDKAAKGQSAKDTVKK